MTNISFDIEDLIKNDDKSCIKPMLIHLFTYSKNETDKILEEFPDHTEQNVLGLMKFKFQKEIQMIGRKYKTQFKKIELLNYYKYLIEKQEMDDNKMFKFLLMKKPANHISGINQVTILTSPTPGNQNFSCKHDCFYCPNEPAHEKNNWTPQPRSYLSLEPAVQRANRNNFDPFEQTKSRLDSLMLCGHQCDKLEFIIEGGTFTEYPKDYLYWFFTRFIYCVNTYFDKPRESYSLEKEIEINTHSKCRIIGICIETRPDAVLENDIDNIPWVKTLLCWGVTRIQLGVQHIDNYILKKINRGHTIETAIEAIRVLKNNCFKIDIHIMPDLPYSSKEKDMAMFDTLYSSDLYQPDQMKVYPCAVVPWTKIEQWYKEGKYVPYGTDNKEIEDVCHYAMTKCPPWIRLPRIVRDIPDTYISGGVKCSNLRQLVNERITKEKGNSMDIRFREIGRHPTYNVNDAELNIRKYNASGGIEYFISYETHDKKAIYGFIRLRIIPKDENESVAYSSTLKNMGLIRELHVYGNVETLRTKNNSSGTQHNGFGKKLVRMAEMIAATHFKSGCVIISGMGVRHYYEKLGYTYEDNYMIKRFSYNSFIHLLFYYVVLYYIYQVPFP